MAGGYPALAISVGRPQEPCSNLRIMSRPGWQPKLPAMLMWAGPGGISGLPGVVLAYQALSGEE